MKKIISAFIAVMLIMSSCFVAFAQDSKTPISTLTYDQYNYYDCELDEYGLGALENTDKNLEKEGIIDYDENNAERYNVVNSRDLQSVVDLSADPSFPPIRSQGWVNSGCSWATTYYQFGYQVANMDINNWNVNSLSNTSEQFSPKFVFNQVNGGDNIGSSFEFNYEVLKTRGAVRYDKFTPLSTHSFLECLEWCTNVNDQTQALEYKISEYEKRFIAPTYIYTPITFPNSTYISTIKNYISTGHVLTFSTSFGKQRVADENSIPGYSNGRTNIDWVYKLLSSGDHSGEKVCIKCEDKSSQEFPGETFNQALSIVGYDDTIWYDYDEDGIQDNFEMGAFKVANSHGTGYGNDGFIWVMYDAFNKESNCNNYNIHRLPVMTNYNYYCIEVEKSNRDLLVYVNVSQSQRNKMFIGLYSIDSLYNTNGNSVLPNQGGYYHFDGTTPTVPQTATFVFDFDILASGDRPWCNYQVFIGNSYNASPTYVNNITIMDRTGKVIESNNYNDTINCSSISYDHYIGMMGDIDNNGTIDNADVLLVQYYASELATLTDSQKLVADVSDDGYVTTYDATLIQQKILGTVVEFPNGAFSHLYSINI